MGFAGEQSNAVLRGGACEKCDLATPSCPDRNGNHGIKFASREFGDKILKFYFLRQRSGACLARDAA